MKNPEKKHTTNNYIQVRHKVESIFPELKEKKIQVDIYACILYIQIVSFTNTHIPTHNSTHICPFVYVYFCPIL